MDGQHVMVSKHLEQDLVKQNICVVQNFNTVAQGSM
jgi:hypothetical protein